MRLFAGLVFAAKANFAGKIPGLLVKNWCGRDLNDYYDTADLNIEYRVNPRKMKKPNKRAHEEVSQRHPRSLSRYRSYPKNKSKPWKSIKEKAYERDVVRVNCAAKYATNDTSDEARGWWSNTNYSPMGGYPVQKISPIIKCVRAGDPVKGIEVDPQLKPNARRWRRSKVRHWYENNCV